MGDAQAPSQTSSDRPTTLGGWVLVELVRLVAILTLVGCACGLVWAVPLAWEGRPQTWWGWVLLVGGLVFGSARILLGGRPPGASGTSQAESGASGDRPQSRADT